MMLVTGSCWVTTWHVSWQEAGLMGDMMPWRPCSFSSWNHRRNEKFKANNSLPRNSLNKFQPGCSTNSALTSSLPVRGEKHDLTLLQRTTENLFTGTP
jgi:hypothetical protein